MKTACLSKRVMEELVDRSQVSKKEKNNPTLELLHRLTYIPLLRRQAKSVDVYRNDDY